MTYEGQPDDLTKFLFLLSNGYYWEKMEILAWPKIIKTGLGKAESLYLQREKKLESDVNNRCMGVQNDKWSVRGQMTQRHHHCDVSSHLNTRFREKSPVFVMARTFQGLCQPTVFQC